VLLDDDLQQRAGHGGGDLGVDLVGRDLQQRLVDRDLLADRLQPTGHGALGHALAQRRQRHRGALTAAAARLLGGRLLLLGRGLLGGGVLGRELLGLLGRGVGHAGLVGGGLALLGALVGARRLGSLGGVGAALVATAAAVADDGEVGADLVGLVLLDQDLLEHAGDRGGDLGVDLVGRDLQQRLVDRDLLADRLQPTGHGA